MKIDKRLKIVIAAVILAACAFGGYTYYQSQQTAKQAKAIETAEPLLITFTTIFSVESLINESAKASTEPSTSALTMMLSS